MVTGDAGDNTRHSDSVGWSGDDHDAGQWWRELGRVGRIVRSAIEPARAAGEVTAIGQQALGYLIERPPEVS